MRKTLMFMTCCIFLSICQSVALAISPAEVILSNHDLSFPNALPASLASDHEKLYILGKGGLYVWSEDQSANLLSDAPFAVGSMDTSTQEGDLSNQSLLVCDTGRLLVIDANTGKWYQFKENVFTLGGQLAWDGIEVAEGESVMRYFSRPTLKGDTLYGMLTTVDVSTMKSRRSLLAFNLTSGLKTELFSGTFEAYAVKDADHVFLLEPDSEYQLYMRIISQRISTGERSEIYASECLLPGIFLYEPVRDAILFSDQREIKRVQNDKTTLVGYINPNVGWLAPATLVQNDKVAVLTPNTDVSIYVLDEGVAALTALRIESDNGDHVNNYRQDHPEELLQEVTVPPITIEQYYTYLQHDVTAPEVYMRYTTELYTELKNRDYLLDLSKSDILRKRTESYYPFIREALQRDGSGIYAVPNDFWINAWTFNESIWEECHAGAPPTTFLELLDILDTWDNDEYALIDLPQEKRFWLVEALKNYVLQNYSEDKPLSFDNIPLRDTLQAIKEMQEKEYSGLPAAFYPHCYRLGERWGDEALEQGKWIVPLMVDRSGQPRIFCDSYAYMVNTASKQQERAIAFLEYVAQYDMVNFPFRSILMSPSENEPIISPSYLNSKETEKKRLEDLQTRLSQSNGEDRLAVQSEIDTLQKELADESGMWLVSAEEIDQYRSIAPFLTFADGQPVMEGRPLFDMLLSISLQYIDGVQPLDVVIKEMDRVTQAAYNEQIR